MGHKSFVMEKVLKEYSISVLDKGDVYEYKGAFSTRSYPKSIGRLKASWLYLASIGVQVDLLDHMDELPVQVADYLEEVFCCRRRFSEEELMGMGFSAIVYEDGGLGRLRPF